MLGPLAHKATGLSLIGMAYSRGWNILSSICRCSLALYCFVPPNFRQNSYNPTHICNHIHTHTITLMHMAHSLLLHTHSRSHSNTTPKHANTYAHSWSCIFSQGLIYWLVQTHAYTEKNMHAHAHMHTHAHMSTRTHTSICAYTHTHTKLHVRACTYMYG